MLTAASRRFVLTLVAAAGAAILAAVPALGASAATGGEPVQLSLKPVGQPGPYFDLTMAPGQSMNLQVELGNHGSTGIEARTFAADAYSIVNGGFGVKDPGSAPSGTTTWLTYPTEVLQLPAGRASIRDFTVTVPEGTTPGQYIAALAIENAVPVAGAGDIALNQLVRRAIAVSIRVPGQLHPAFAYGTANHEIVADRSVVSIRISNTGNVNLKPAGRLVVRDSSGKIVSNASVTMDSLYAHDTTTVEATLGGVLQPGRYTAGITLKDDATGATRSAADLPFAVAAKAAEKSVGAQQGVLPAILQSGSTATATVTMVVAGVVALALASCAYFFLRARSARKGGRRKSHRGGRARKH